MSSMRKQLPAVQVQLPGTQVQPSAPRHGVFGPGSAVDPALRASSATAASGLSRTTILPVRQPHAIEPLPIDQIMKMANRVSVEMLMMVIAYGAILLSMTEYLSWFTVFLAVICALGIYHARMRMCAAAYYGRKSPLVMFWLSPLYSMVIVTALMAAATFCVALGFSATVVVAGGLTFLFAGPDYAMTIAVFVAIIPGVCLGVILAVSVVSELGKRWLKLL
jgi:hypothetical protein